MTASAARRTTRNARWAREDRAAARAPLASTVFKVLVTVALFSVTIVPAFILICAR